VDLLGTHSAAHFQHSLLHRSVPQEG
jgi:hypothetical protein